MTVEKTYQPTTMRQQQEGSSFFRKTEEQGFFSQRESPSFFNAARVQPKLSISQPDDPEEKEADAVADWIMRLPESLSECLVTAGQEADTE